VVDFVLRKLDDDIQEMRRRRAAGNRRSTNAALPEIVSGAPLQPEGGTRSYLKALARDIRSLSVGRPQTLSEYLLHESRGETPGG
jgi:plasmid stability protein